MNIHSVETELFHADVRTVRHDGANSHFSQFCKFAYKVTLHVETSVSP